MYNRKIFGNFNKKDYSFAVAEYIQKYASKVERDFKTETTTKMNLYYGNAK